jgi:cytochrome b
MQHAASIDSTQADEVKVWDLFVRIFHWTVAIGFFVAYVSEDALTVHVWAGYLVGGLVLLRIVWGFVGPRHARFADFLFSPFKILSYTWSLLTLRGRERYVGHSPAGAGMVYALLLGMLVITGSGLVLYAIEENAGPLAGVVGAGPSGATPAMGEAERAYGEADEEEHGGEYESEGGEGGEEFWEEVHEVAANLVLVLVIVHIAGVLLASFVHQENLTRGMITGRKHGPGA